MFNQVSNINLKKFNTRVGAVVDPIASFTLSYFPPLFCVPPQKLPKSAPTFVKNTMKCIVYEICTSKHTKFT